MPHPYLQAARERWFNPYKRYQHSRLIHAVRLGLAVIAATLLARLLQLAHGEWVAITVFVVLGMLQFQGAIYSKAAERMIGYRLGRRFAAFVAQPTLSVQQRVLFHFNRPAQRAGRLK